MAKRNTVGYQAQLLRKKGERRIEKLQQTINASKDKNASNVRWAEQQIKEIKSAMQGTRMYSSTGRKYKKTASEIQKQVSRLEKAVSEVPVRYSQKGDSFLVTQKELNKASVGAPSVYTKTEAKLFYRVFQKVWQKEGVGEHQRNQAILDHVNSNRKANGLTPLRLDEIVDYVINANKDMSNVLENAMQFDELSEEQQDFYGEMAAADDSDSEIGSPPGITQVVVSGIIDALGALLEEPNLLVI